MQEDGLSLTPSAAPDELCQPPPHNTHNPQQRLYPIIPRSFKHPHTHQPEVMRLVARVLHSWEVMRNRNALNSRSGIHRWGCVCAWWWWGSGGSLGNKNKAELRALTAPSSTTASEFTKCLNASEEFKIYRVRRFWNSGYLQRFVVLVSPGACRVYAAEGFSWDSEVKCL